MSQDDTAEEPDEDLWEAFDDYETLPCSCSYVSWVALSDAFLPRHWLIHKNGESS